ncbi:hypothetical protein DFH11DRAFT_1727387 [Phellopilus nigrolimitatus]|nr:hypothetical protein DFH11DRAFT_1727387 [Phellopilus nigrolimitatus]
MTTTAGTPSFSPCDLFGNADSNQYSGWNRTRRLRAPTFLARVDTNASRSAAAIHNANMDNNDVALNMGDLAPSGGADVSGKENRDTLFGPSIGVVGTSPEWCNGLTNKKSEKPENKKEGKEGKVLEDDDELTPDVVQEWVKRSAEQHGLEFEFDCDAPKCSITLTVVGVPEHLAEDPQQQNGESRDEDKEKDCLLLFETTVEGGFARKLQLSDGAVLELTKLESAARQARLVVVAANRAAGYTSEPVLGHGAGDVVKSPEHGRKRLTFFRKRGHANSSTNNSNSSESANPNTTVTTTTTGPALAVVDAEAAAHRERQLQQAQGGASADAAGNGSERTTKNARKNEDGDEGVKVLIHLSALDAQGLPLRVRNEQVTYLHIVRHGPPSASLPVGGESTGSAINAAETGASASENLGGEDMRPWVVKVVKREARIGPHSFHLHEIYGLTAHSAEPAHPVAPTADVAHTYPPTADAAASTNANAYADPDPSAECLLCLSAAREVVLLPCRHLVACRECAVNMVEFGAGGTLVHNEGDGTDAPANAAGSAGDAAADGNGNENATADANGNGETNAPAAAPAPVPTMTSRRKRKPKGWFCPVCRQPYTSLLRITTTPLPSKLDHAHAASKSSAEGKRTSLASSLEPEHVLAGDAAAPGGLTGQAAAEQGQATESRGAFASLSRPGFLRHFVGLSNGEETRDLERGA